MARSERLAAVAIGAAFALPLLWWGTSPLEAIQAWVVAPWSTGEPQAETRDVASNSTLQDASAEERYAALRRSSADLDALAPVFDSLLAALVGGRERSLGVDALESGQGSDPDRDAIPARVGRSAVEDFSYRNRDPSFFDLPPEAFDPRDLAVLEEIIALNELDEASSDADYDDGDGRMDPRELGDQRWCDGRLRELRLGPDAFSTFGYRVTRLPESIRDLDGLMILEANAVGLREVPLAIGELPGLRRVSMFGNQISELPAGLASGGQLAEIQVTGNPITQVPRDVAESPTLERLFVDMRSLQEVPPMLERQSEQLAAGTLELPARDVGPLGRSCLPQS